MRESTVALRASTLGDALGIGWFLRDVGGVRTVGHGRSANERGFFTRDEKSYSRGRRPRWTDV
jgi:hypothetical protein